jgi:hypothetical protein
LPWRYGANKTPPFHDFPIAKGETKTIAHLSIVEGLSLLSLDWRIYNCKLGNEKKRLNQSAHSEFPPQTYKSYWQFKNKEVL